SCHSVVKVQRTALLTQQTIHELLEEKTPLGHRFRIGQPEFTVILDEHRITRRFQEQNRRVVLMLIQQRQVVLAEPLGPRQMALAARSATAALASRWPPNLASR